MTERVAIFIDGANLFYGLKDDLQNINLDFEKLVYKLLGSRNLVRVYYYSALPNQQDDQATYIKQQKFLSALQKKPYFKVVIGRLEKREGIYTEKGVDVTLAVDMLDLAFSNIYETAILISGDADFAHAVEVVQRLGKHVENASTKSCISIHLQSMCDTFLLLDKEFLKDCWRNKNNP
jgi:uncharacterized LabA/DUF88 family protein